MTGLSDAIWTELDKAPAEKGTARKPVISSLRRNLQKEHMERLIEFTLPGAGFTAAYKPISTLARAELQKILRKIRKAQKSGAGKYDPYTSAHLAQAAEQIQKALNAEYVYNQDSGGSGFGGLLFFREEEKQKRESVNDR